MPIHDWLRVEAGIFHAFHQQWLIAISNALNSGILPADYYALPEQYDAGFGPDVLTLQDTQAVEDGPNDVPTSGSGGLLVAEPKIEVTAETDLEFYRANKTPSRFDTSAAIELWRSSRSFHRETSRPGMQFDRSSIKRWNYWIGVSIY